MTLLNSDRVYALAVDAAGDWFESNGADVTAHFASGTTATYFNGTHGPAAILGIAVDALGNVYAGSRYAVQRHSIAPIPSRY